MNKIRIESFAEEARNKSKGKVKSAIAERWNTRVVPRGLHLSGRDGARAYLESYGKGIAAPKVVELALCAEAMGAEEMARGFWEAAFELATGRRESFAGGATAETPVSAPGPRAAGGAGAVGSIDGLPPDIQPGLVATMQPTDAGLPRGSYVLDDGYLGQPKRDGHRNLLFASSSRTFHQGRSTGDLGQIGPEFEEAARKAAKKLGPFALDGERYYLSAAGGEHRTAAQAAAANVSDGKPEVRPIAVYAAFEALAVGGRSLLGRGKLDRIKAARAPVAMIAELLRGHAELVQIELVPTAVSGEEKKRMAEAQEKQGREGEVWTLKDSVYTGGKGHGCSVRTKYTHEGEFTVTGYKETTAKGRKVGSFQVAWPDGRKAGSVGTGFDAATGTAIADAVRKNPGQVKIKVRHQGTTEGGVLWHARFLEVA